MLSLCYWNDIQRITNLFYGAKNERAVIEITARRFTSAKA